jgi:hypothetical protein
MGGEEMNDLVEWWQGCSLESSPYRHPDDKKDIPENRFVNYSFKEYVKSNEFGLKNNKLHLGLIPVPYMGDLEHSSIFILMANPGLKNIDYYAEQENKELRQTLKNNLIQEGLDKEFPFACLNPKFSWYSGYEYWERRFYNLIKDYQEEKRIKFLQALSHIAQRISVLELIPYHSLQNPRDNLKSKENIRKYVLKILVPKAKKGKICIIDARGRWELPDNIYESSNILWVKSRQNPSFAPENDCGKLIMKFLKKAEN